jgi:CheY-like chemotaxis protein
LVEEDHGHETALKSARFLVMFFVRPGGQAQYSHMLSHQAVTSRPKRRSGAILSDRVQSEFAQKRILCVDDNVVELTLRGKILELQGYSVVLLSCPKQALRCDLSAFDLAVLDFDMPGLNGKDLFLRMRALHARFPILLLSACASTLCPDDCVLFSKCLNKGEPVGRLLDVIAAFLDPNEIPDFGR